MAGKLIISATEVRDRYSLQDLKDINSALDSGIPGAHFFFQGILGTEFDEAAHTDVFYIDTAIIPEVNKQFRLRLTQAFVKPGSTSISFGSTRKAAPSAVPDGDIMVDFQRGLVFLDAQGESGSYNNQFVSVSYTAGFGTDTAATKPPAWLKEALLSWMASVLVYSAYKEEPQKALPIAEALKREAAQMVERYKRETALQFLPINF